MNEWKGLLSFLAANLAYFVDEALITSSLIYFYFKCSLYMHAKLFKEVFLFVSESEEEVEEEQEERQPSPEPVQENASSTYYENHPVT